MVLKKLEVMRSSRVIKFTQIQPPCGRGTYAISIVAEFEEIGENETPKLLRGDTNLVLTEITESVACWSSGHLDAHLE